MELLSRRRRRLNASKAKAINSSLPISTLLYVAVCTYWHVMVTSEFPFPLPCLPLLTRSFFSTKSCKVMDDSSVTCTVCMSMQWFFNLVNLLEVAMLCIDHVWQKLSTFFLHYLISYLNVKSLVARGVGTLSSNYS
ncbi:hypothetical protein BJX64DRAFT_236901 [Aspergillus heterothallicus]